MVSCLPRPARVPLSVLAWGVLVLLAMGVGPALAAVDGRLTPASAQAGDWVELTTDTDGGDPNAYAPIAAAGALPVFLQRAATQSTGNSCDTPIGHMTWAGSVGALRFQVPDVEPGSYWVLAAVQGDCWRFGGSAGVLTLTIRPSVERGVPLPILGGAVLGAAAAVAVALLLVRRHRPAI